MGADSFWDFIPTNGHTDADMTKIADFLERGGRFVIVGEHNGYAPQANKEINELSEFLGGSITVQYKTYSPGLLVRENNEIANVPSCQGVNKFTTAAYAPLTVDKDKTDVLMTDNTGKIFAADQYLKKGRLTVWADINPTSPNYMNGNNNADFYRNLVHEANGFVEQVQNGQDPNAARKCGDVGPAPTPQPTKQPTPQPTKQPTPQPTKQPTERKYRFQLVESSCPYGYSKVPTYNSLNGDINQGSGGKYIYLCQENGANAVTLVEGGCNYGYSKAPVYNSLNGDLNQGAGGKYIYACQRNGVNALQVVEGGCNGGWHKVPIHNSLNGDLNQGAGGKYIYFCERN